MYTARGVNWAVGGAQFPDAAVYASPTDRTATAENDFGG